MFRNLRLFRFKYFLNKEKQKQQIQREFVGLKDAKYVGILFDAGDENNLAPISEFVRDLEKRAKKVKVLAYIDSGQVADNGRFDTFSRKQTNWFFKPSDDLTKNFIDQKFDILINVFFVDYAPLEYISTFSKAKFRVGPYLEDKTHCFDFMVNKKTDSYHDFIQKIDHFLSNVINNKDTSV